MSNRPITGEGEEDPLAPDRAPFPAFISAGDILTDLVRSSESQWVAHPGGAGWNGMAYDSTTGKVSLS